MMNFHAPLRTVLVRTLALVVMATTFSACAQIYAAQSLERYLERDHVTALSSARAALARDKTNKDALGMAGWSNFQLGRYRKSQGKFREILHFDANNFDALLGMGWTQFKLGHIDVAAEYFQQAKKNVELPWQRRFIFDALGWVEIRRRNYAGAKKLFTEELSSLEYAEETADPQVGLGWIALLQKDYAQARTMFEHGLKIDGNCFNCYDGLARAALQTSDLDSALKYALSGVEHVRHSKHLVALLNHVLERLGNHKRSVAIYERLVRRYPDAAFYHAALGAAYSAQRRFVEAEKSLKRALELDPDHSGAQRAIQKIRKARASSAVLGFAPPTDPNLVLRRKAARWSARHGAVQPAADHGLAMKIVPAVYVKSDDDPKLAMLDLRFGQAGEAEGGFLKPQKISLSNYNKGWAFIDAGSLDEAERAFRTAEMQAPEQLKYLMRDALGWVAYYRRDYDKAEQVFMEVLNARPDSFLSRKGLGFVALERKQYQEAVKWITESLSQNPYQVPLSYVVPAQRLIDVGRYNEARRILQMGEWAYPRVPEILFLHARSLAGLNQIRLAAEKAEVAVGLSPTKIQPKFDDLRIPQKDLLPATRALAWGLLQAGEHAAASRRFGQIIKLGGKFPDAVRGRGFALFRLGKYKEAIKDLAEAATYEPEKLAAMSHELPIPGTDKRALITYNARSTMAWAYLRIGNAARAELEFRKVLKEHRHWVDALSGLGYSLLAQNDPVGAERSFQTALRISPMYPDARQGLQAAKSPSEGKQPGTKFRPPK